MIWGRSTSGPCGGLTRIGGHYIKEDDSLPALAAEPHPFRKAAHPGTVTIRPPVNLHHNLLRTMHHCSRGVVAERNSSLHSMAAPTSARVFDNPQAWRTSPNDVSLNHGSWPTATSTMVSGIYIVHCQCVP